MLQEVSLIQLDARQVKEGPETFAGIRFFERLPDFGMTARQDGSTTEATMLRRW